MQHWGKMIVKKIKLKQSVSDSEYTALCNVCTRQGVFRACGSCEEKYIIVGFENEIDYAAWLVAMGLAKVKEDEGWENFYRRQK